MKSFWIGLLIFILVVMGFTSICFIGALAYSNWRYLFMLIAIPTMVAPCVFWWQDYFIKLFKTKPTKPMKHLLIASTMFLLFVKYKTLLDRLKQ